MTALRTAGTEKGKVRGAEKEREKGDTLHLAGNEPPVLHVHVYCA